MNKAIETAIETLAAARRNLRHVLRQEQPKCAHARVIHSPWRSSQYGSAFKARRLCLDCGLEEEAENGGWGDHDSDFPNLKTKGFHKVVPDQEIYNARIPEAANSGLLGEEKTD